MWSTITMGVLSVTCHARPVSANVAQYPSVVWHESAERTSALALCTVGFCQCWSRILDTEFHKLVLGRPV